jgi:hypothetical protein
MHPADPSVDADQIAQAGQEPIEIGAAGEPTLQGGDREGVTQIVHPWPAAWGTGRDPRRSEGVGPVVLHQVGPGPVAGSGHEQRWGGGGHAAIAEVLVGGDRGEGRTVEGDLAGLVELGTADQDRRVVGVDVGVVEADHLRGGGGGGCNGSDS